MPKVHEGQLDATGRKFGIVVSRFNDLVTTRLLGGALDCIKRHGGDEDDILNRTAAGDTVDETAVKRGWKWRESQLRKLGVARAGVAGRVAAAASPTARRGGRRVRHLTARTDCGKAL